MSLVKVPWQAVFLENSCVLSKVLKSDRNNRMCANYKMGISLMACIIGLCSPKNQERDSVTEFTQKTGEAAV